MYVDHDDSINQLVRSMALAEEENRDLRAKLAAVLAVPACRDAGHVETLHSTAGCCDPYETPCAAYETSMRATHRPAAHPLHNELDDDFCYSHGTFDDCWRDEQTAAVPPSPAEQPHAYETAWKGPPGSEAGCTKPGRWGNCGAPRSAAIHRTTVQKDGAAPTECTPTGPTPRDRAGCGGVGCPCSDDCYTNKENQP